MLIGLSDEDADLIIKALKNYPYILDKKTLIMDTAKTLEKCEYLIFYIKDNIRNIKKKE